jgi:hypothetical protein
VHQSTEKNNGNDEDAISIAGPSDSSAMPNNQIKGVGVEKVCK